MTSDGHPSALRRPGVGRLIINSVDVRHHQVQLP
jgi:hypothetical protein